MCVKNYFVLQQLKQIQWRVGANHGNERFVSFLVLRADPALKRWLNCLAAVRLWTPWG
jgi:hypothetical protein